MLSRRFGHFGHGVSLAAVTLIVACTQFPQLDSQITKGAADKPYPNLIPVENIRSTIPEARVTEETGTDLQARVDALRARAKALSGPVLDPATRRKLEAGISPPLPSAQ